MSHRQLSPTATILFILIAPLTVPVLFFWLGPNTDHLRAQEVAPKQALTPPSRSSESTTRQRPLVTGARVEEWETPSRKPSGKMEFLPDSQASRFNRPTTARPVGNSVARRQSQPAQPQKIAATRSAAIPAGTRSKTHANHSLPAPAPEPVNEPLVESVAEVELLPAPVVDAARIEEPAPVELPKLVEKPTFDEEPTIDEVPKFVEVPKLVEKPIRIATKQMELPDFDPFQETNEIVNSQPDPPSPFRQQPEQEFELPTVRVAQRPGPMLNDEPQPEAAVATNEAPRTGSNRDIVELFFEDESPEFESMNENMDLVESEPMERFAPARTLKQLLPTFDESSTVSEIQIVAAQKSADEEKVAPAAVTDADSDDVQLPSDVILAELKPVRSIEIRKAVEVPPLAATDNPQLLEPSDQARAMLRKRPPFKFWPVYRDPWVGSRDSFAFHSNPLWFEDPNLERCGRGYKIVSALTSPLHFGTNIVILPYRMSAEPAWSCARALPDCTVCEKFGCKAYLPPWSWRAAAVQAAAITGLVYIIP